MANKVLVLGGYGNFGKRIAQLLTRQGVPVIVAGRNAEKAQKFAATLPQDLAEVAVFDMSQELDKALERLEPKVVINTCGPFQTRDYEAALICVRRGIAYIDLADGRDFVANIDSLDKEAMQHHTLVVSGASTVPGLSSAIVEHYLPLFDHIEEMRFGIAPGQKAERGLATTQGILSYVGRRLKPCAGYPSRYGWQDLYRQAYPGLGKRWMANCDIPDLDLLPRVYPIRRIRFSAGMESTVGHLGIWAMGWLVRMGLPLQLENYAASLLKFSHVLDAFGSSDGGMHVVLDGVGRGGQPLVKTWFIVAKDGDGPYIPTIPAVALAKKIVTGELKTVGAMPCVGLVTLEEYLAELAHLKIETFSLDDLAR